MWIEELSDGKFKYVERYTDPYTEKIKKTSTVLTSNSAQAKKKAQKILEDKIAKKIIKLGQNDMTFQQLYDKWIPIYSQNVKEQTVKHAESLYKVAISRIDKNSIVRNIDGPFIQNILDQFYYEENYSYSYTDSFRAFLSNLFEYAKKIGVADRNILREIKLKKKIVAKEKENNVTAKYLEPREVDIVLDEVRNWIGNIKPQRKKRYADMLELISLTGLRFGEASALTVDDLNGNRLTINKTLYYNYGNLKSGDTQSPKNEFSNRTIVLSNRTIEILQEWKLENELNKAFNLNYNDMGFLFSDEVGTPIGISPVNRILRNVRNKLSEEGILHKNLTTHIFRHTHISQLSELGLPLKTIMARVGHENPNTTLRIYTHVTDQMEQNLLDKLNELEQKRESLK